MDLLNLFYHDQNIQKLNNAIIKKSAKNIYLKNLHGSQASIIASHLINKKTPNLFILNSLEDALYFLDDIHHLNKKLSIHLFPSSERINIGDNSVLIERINVLEKLSAQNDVSVVTYPKAIFEEVITKENFQKKKIKLKKGDVIDQDYLCQKLNEYGFQMTDFVLQPGDFSIRGNIIDVFSYGSEMPYRIVLDNDNIDEINLFEISSQLSKKNINNVNIISNIESQSHKSITTNIFTYLRPKTNIWINNPSILLSQTDCKKKQTKIKNLKSLINKNHCVVTGNIIKEIDCEVLLFNSNYQPSFNQNFEILIDKLNEFKSMGYKNIITVSNTSQMNRLMNIFDNYNHLVQLVKCENSLKEGFIDHDNKILLFTDHQIFERHHQYKSKRRYKTQNTSSIKDITNLKKGDYITHFDYGIGKFDGLRIKKENDKNQESIRMIYKNGDILYISIHSLHKIAKYKDAENEVKLDKLGSPRWKKLKEKVKKKIKTVAFDLIKLYAKRKMKKGFSFSKDTYLQHELEASFIFQETEDQIKITNEVKQDMESISPMDRLICGDVGFGKTEIAIRAAFKAVADNKQVAILVPTTILALQHNKTFQKRLKNFPCRIKYLNRFIAKKETLLILDELKEGLIDIIIGTHRLISNDVVFKDLGLLIIDEEQKFGVSTKDKLKTLRENVDTLTLTATPIPRTLQFSLMGSRDLSIMTTYPKNRNPIETTISVFNQKNIQEMITYEVSRNGQVFFVHNRISNIEDVCNMIKHMQPNLNIRFAHGQMESKKLENTILDFINGKFDVLITTTIIENGLDIPNANTIIINDAQNFGLADLHQMRGRVGRSNKKAFCYLLTPPFNKLKDSGLKRLNAIANLSNLGDGFNIAMKDLEIRGAGNMLGAEQSGFIEEMGFSTYQKILHEAIEDLKENKFKKQASSINNNQNRIQCVIETDLELFLPSNYISNVNERMDIYKRLSEIIDKKDITKYEDELNDRFGQIPIPTIALLESIRLKILAEKLKCEKIILKQGKMIITFNHKIEQAVFNQVIKLIKGNKSENYTIKEIDNFIKLYVKNIDNIYDAVKILKNFDN